MFNENINYMKTMKIKELKKLLVDLEQERGNIDELEIWIQPAGTPSVEVYGMGIVNVSSNNAEQHGKEVFGVYLEGDCF
jgi:phage-related protein